ncbi:MAG: carboxypeptidase-like regulatory domain-containing protein [Methanobrevibacter woesei]|nr:carboxypeptidase-like regulatory domain-containing protein [Methanobrevibacter woesei]
MTPENVSVSVTDSESSAGIENVTVTLKDAEEQEYSGTTGSAGGCTIQNVPPGEYSVTATAAGYNQYTGSFTVSSSSKNLSISMTATG